MRLQGRLQHVAPFTEDVVNVPCQEDVHEAGIRIAIEQHVARCQRHLPQTVDADYAYEIALRKKGCADT